LFRWIQSLRSAAALGPRAIPCSNRGLSKSTARVTLGSLLLTLFVSITWFLPGLLVDLDFHIVWFKGTNGFIQRSVRLEMITSSCYWLS
jgi:hypothetical protein